MVFKVLPIVGVEPTIRYRHRLGWEGGRTHPLNAHAFNSRSGDPHGVDGGNLPLLGVGAYIGVLASGQAEAANGGGGRESLHARGFVARNEGREARDGAIALEVGEASDCGGNGLRIASLRVRSVGRGANDLGR